MTALAWLAVCWLLSAVTFGLELDGTWRQRLGSVIVVSLCALGLWASTMPIVAWLTGSP